MAFHKDRILSTLKALNLGMILGFSVGLVIAVLHIKDNRLIYHKLYNLILFEIQTIVTEYFIVFTVFVLILVALDRLLKRIMQTGILKRLDALDSEKRLPLAVSVSLVFYIVIALICYLQFPYIIEFLKNTSIAEPLRALSKSKVYVYVAFFILFFVTAVSFISVLTYLLVRLNIVGPVQKRLSAVKNSRLTQALGILIVGAVVIYNAAILGYKELNKPEGPNVILITIDTLRADHLGAYGYYRDISPNIDKLAEKGILFENAYSQAPWTLPSMASMHTSYYPSQIRIENIRGRIHDDFITLAEYMKNNFYKTSAVISNIVVSDIFGFSQGFETFDQTPLRARDDITSHLVTERAVESISDNRSNKFFLWIHYMDPHSNYIHHPEFGYASNYKGTLGRNIHYKDLNKRKRELDRKDLEYIKDLYDEEISYTDMHIGRLIDTLGELGLSDNTIIIITADHGEEFMERNRFGHNTSLYQELIHVPLIIYVPSYKGARAKRAKSAVEIRSIAKTILDLCGIRNNHFGGDNLLVTAEDKNTDSHAFSQKPKGRKLETIIGGNWKLIKRLYDNRYELYDLESDPGEKTNLFEAEGVNNSIIKDLISKSSGIDKESLGELAEVEFKEEDIKKLKALGYIQ